MRSTLRSIIKILLIVFLVLYLGVEVFVTVCLLNYNDQGVTEFGNKTLVIMTEDLSDTYQKGDLVVVSKDDGSMVVEDDFIFFYNPSDEGVVNFAEVNEVIESNNYYTYVVSDDYNVYYDYYIGKDTIVLKRVGAVLSLLESKWGFLILIILPTIVAIIFELYAILIELVELKKEA